MLGLRGMNRKKQNAKVIIDPKIRFGKPIIKGTRITAKELAGYLDSGMTEAEIKKEYGVTQDDIEVVMLYELEQSWEEFKAGKGKLLHSLADLD